jgi:DnaJ-class molecular chaperone
MLKCIAVSVCRHPDLHEGDSKKVAEAKFKEASEAYDVLHAHMARSRMPAA